MKVFIGVYIFGFIVQVVLTNFQWDEIFGQHFLDSANFEATEYYTNLITLSQQRALSYELPNNSYQHIPWYTNLKHFGKFDFIIVGAGSAGTVIANRLSEIKEWKILLLDAGNFGNNLTDIPNMAFPVQFTEYNWGYFTIPQKTSCLGMVNRQCPFPRGKGIGGTTLINGLIYSRGSKKDFDRWAALGNSGWSYDEVLPYFIKSENYNRRDQTAPVNPNIHGSGGYLNVEYHLPQHRQVTAFIDANRELGWRVDDYNSPDGLGASPVQINTLNGRRFDGGKAFIEPVLNRKNLWVLPKAFVDRVVINPKTKIAEAVTFSHSGQNFIANAKQEVILSAGVVGSAQLLMLSGVGPEKHLQHHGIHVIRNLEVGTTLRDHPAFFGLIFETGYSEPILSIREYARQYLRGIGPYTAPSNNHAAGFYESSFTKGSNYPDIEIIVIPSNATNELYQRGLSFTNETYEDLWGTTDQTRSFILYIIALHTESLGSVRLKSANPFDYPVIDSRFLSDQFGKDIRTIYEGIQIGLKIANTRAFRKLNTRLRGGPLRACSKYPYKSEAYWYCAIRQIAMDMYHPVGTCPMGPDPRKGAVVDAKLKVHGIQRLRVADASVFPFTLSGHPNAPTVMIAEKLSDMIKDEYFSINFFTNGQM